MDPKQSNSASQEEEENLFGSSNPQQDDDLFGDSTSGDFSSFLGNNSGLENLSLNENKASSDTQHDDGRKSTTADTIQIMKDNDEQVQSLESITPIVDNHNICSNTSDRTTSLATHTNTTDDDDDNLFGTSSDNDPFMKEISLNENTSFLDDETKSSNHDIPTLPSVLSPPSTATPPMMNQSQRDDSMMVSSPSSGIRSPRIDTTSNQQQQQQQYHHEKTPPPLSSPPPPPLATTSNSTTSKPSVAMNRGANRYVNSFGVSSNTKSHNTIQSNAVFTPPSPHPTTATTTHTSSMNIHNSGGMMMSTSNNMLQPTPSNMMTNQAGFSLNNGMPPTLNNVTPASSIPSHHHQRMISSPPPSMMMMNTSQHNLTGNTSTSGIPSSTNSLTNHSGHLQQFENQSINSMPMMNSSSSYSTTNATTGQTRNMMTPPPVMGTTPSASSFVNNSVQDNMNINQFNNNIPSSNMMNPQFQSAMYSSSYQQGCNSVSPTNLLTNQSGAVMEGIRSPTGYPSMNNQFTNYNNYTSGMNALPNQQLNIPSSQYSMNTSTFIPSYDSSAVNNNLMNMNQFGMMNNSQYPTMSMMMGMNNPQMMYHSQRPMSPSYQQNLMLSKQQLQQEHELRLKYSRPVFTFTFGGKIISSFPTTQQRTPVQTSANTFLAGARSPTNFHGGDQPTSQESQGVLYPGNFKVHKLSQVLKIACPMVKSLEDYPIANISQQFDNDSNSAILDQLIKFMNLKIYEKQQILFQQADDQVVGEKMLWELIKIVAKNVNGNIGMVSNDINALLTVLCSSSTAPVDDLVTSSSTSGDVQPEQVVALQNMLINGQIKQACQYAQSNKMWAHAILLSSMVDKQTYQSVVSSFALSALNPGTPLRTLYCTFAGKPLDAFESNSIVSTDQYGNQYSSQSSQDQQQQIEKLCSQWIQNLSILFNNRQGKVSQAAIEKLGDVLWKDCYQVPQSHFCYVLGDFATLISAFAMSQPPSSITSPGRSTPQSQVNQQLITGMIASSSIVNRRVLLIAGDNKRDIRHYISDETMQLTEVFELLKSLMTRNILSSLQNDSQQQFPPVSLLMNSTLLAYKLIYAYYLAEFGYLDKANECCDYLIDIVKKTQQTIRFGIAFKLHLQELKLRIQESSKLTGTPIASSSLASSSSKKQSGGGVTGWFIRGLESIIHGTDSEESSPSSTNNNNTQAASTHFSPPLGHSTSMPNIAGNSGLGIPSTSALMQQQHVSSLSLNQNNMLLSTRPASYTPPPTQTPPPPLSSSSLQQTSQTPPPPLSSSSQDNNGSSSSGGGGVSSWWKGWFGGSSSKSSSSKKEANIGKKNEFYYDESKKRWVRRGQENEVVEQNTAPPPTLEAIPSNNLQSAASQLRGGASRYVNMFSGGAGAGVTTTTTAMTSSTYGGVSSSTPPPSTMMMMNNRSSMNTSTPPPMTSYFMPSPQASTGGSYEIPDLNQSMTPPPPTNHAMPPPPSGGSSGGMMMSTSNNMLQPTPSNMMTYQAGFSLNNGMPPPTSNMY
ncbi:hypothetical protein FDP41_010851 [Naegleria fowleri]|uniref:Protein transport protein sec16 n=1 Tax=Naegleria fowleri TaxID=5763 RepID=A0A6A5C7L8_NAEFO|nr:uncharacterized protein FDP41_010851 [Naegleria fowleri]KAF0982872.1 hypothetical protein FDP41_010851 [Naegleria fowleri]